MLNPGDIFEVAQYIGTDLNGQALCRSKEHGLVRSYRILKKHERNSLRTQLKSSPITVVAVGISTTRKDQRLVLFASREECEQLLVDFFYQRDPHGNLSGRGTRDLSVRDLWIRRWTDAAEIFNQVQCDEPHSLHQPPNALMCWKIASTPRWLMPVLMQKQCACLTDKYRFCPAEQYEYGFSSPSCTSASSVFPRTFTVTLKNDTDGQCRDAQMVLHGFIRPKTWHFKFWTHVASASPKALFNAEYFRDGKPERVCWEEILTNPVPNGLAFSACQEVNGRCADCSNNTFSAVHSDCQNSLDEYTELAVTVFERAVTKKMSIKAYPGTPGTAARWRASVQCRDDMTATRSNGVPKLGMDGVCYNWDTESPIIHLFFLTFFIQTNPKDIWPDDMYNNLFWWLDSFDSWSITNVK
ncbi:MAG: hypothetical protein Q4G66_12260 [bacterium]|nr:hypothetical protein [bacterium]